MQTWYIPQHIKTYKSSFMKHKQNNNVHICVNWMVYKNVFYKIVSAVC